MKTKTIPGTCSSANCNGAAIAAELVDGAWVSHCLKHFKRSGKIDWSKAIKNNGGSHWPARTCGAPNATPRLRG